MATQTCDRTVSGRNFDYASALSIIQDEEYLEDEDFDDIRLFRKQGEVIQALESFEEKISDDNQLLRQPKGFFESIFDYFKEDTSNNEEIELDYDSELVEEFDNHILKREKRFICGTNIPAPQLLDANGKRRRRDARLFDLCINDTMFTNPGMPFVAATVLSVCAGALAANPAPTNVPNNSPQPGTPGGGGVPTGTEGILALVPAGLLAVAVFPPFLPPRRVPAEAVIFKEAPGTVPGVDTGRRKRSFGYCPEPSFWKRLQKNIRCLVPRLKRKFGRRPAPSHDYGYHGKKKRDIGYGHSSFDDGCGECGTIEDCFDEPCPRYGFMARYTFTRGDQNNGGGYAGQSHGFTERQTGEGFRSAAPPDCRVTAG